jgi:hypothetical protein
MVRDKGINGFYTEVLRGNGKNINENTSRNSDTLAVCSLNTASLLHWDATCALATVLVSLTRYYQKKSLY